MDAPLTAQAFHRVGQTVLPHLNDWLNGLPDPRLQAMCLYSAAHLWWQILATFLSRKGTRNGFDEQRQAGEAAWNLGIMCGQTAEDPRFDGQPTVLKKTTGSGWNMFSAPRPPPPKTTTR
jgi:hypothetical protein